MFPRQQPFLWRVAMEDHMAGVSALRTAALAVVLIWLLSGVVGLIAEEALSIDSSAASPALPRNKNASRATWATSEESGWTNSIPWPSARSRHAMAFDSQSDRIVIFGGNTGEHVDETWAYDFEANTWTNTNPTTKPSARSEHAMAYDSQSDRIVLFGGWTGGSGDRNGETWAYDFEANTWTNMNPTTAPAARYELAVADDCQSDRIVLLEGS